MELLQELVGIWFLLAGSRHLLFKTLQLSALYHPRKPSFIYLHFPVTSSVDNKFERYAASPLCHLLATRLGGNRLSEASETSTQPTILGAISN